MSLTVALMRSLPKRPKRRKAKPIKYPWLLERDYARHIRKVMKEYVKELITELEPSIDEEIRLVQSIFKDAINEKTQVIRGKIRVNERDIEESFIRVARNNKMQFERGTLSVLGVNPLVYEPYLLPTLQLFVTENVSLIKSLQGELLESASKTIMSGVTAGLSRNTISDNLQKLNGVAERRADLIARDQTGKFFGRLTKQRNETIGIKKFIWVTANDDKVRDEHRDLEGKTFTWENGADGLFPGQDINCRCTSMAVLDDIFDELDEDV